MLHSLVYSYEQEPFLYLGNDALHSLTSEGSCELRMDMEDFENVTKFAVYQDFSISNGNDGYRLGIGAYTGTAGK